MTKEQQIKNYITDRFNSMTYDEYENMCCGTGTLSILDEAVSKYDADCELNDDEVTTLAEYCNKESTAFGKRFAMYQLSQELTYAITSAFRDTDGVGRLSFWVNKLKRYAESSDYEHINNYCQLMLELAAMHKLDSDDVIELDGIYADWLQNKANSIMDGFAKMCDERNVDYDDPDEWLQWLQNDGELNWQEMRYINLLWDDEAKAKYRLFKDKAKYDLIKMMRITNTESGYELSDETDYHDWTVAEAVKDFQSKYDNCDFQLTAIKED